MNGGRESGPHLQSTVHTQEIGGENKSRYVEKQSEQAARLLPCRPRHLGGADSVHHRLAEGRIQTEKGGGARRSGQEVCEDGAKPLVHGHGGQRPAP
jgi:hypothetical protein